MNKKRPRLDGFYIAPFAPDGEGLGTAFWHFSKLSPRWIETCLCFLSAHGAVFKASWGQQLQKIETRLTSENGTGIGTFDVNGIPAVSTLYVSGMDQAADRQVTDLFIASLRKVEYVRQVATIAEPFSSIHSIDDRPLAALVVWQNPNISDEDFDLVRELCNHFAAAFFMQQLPQTQPDT